MRIINWDSLSQGWCTSNLAKVKHAIKPINDFEILDNTKSIFVHIPKNAGSSVSKTLYDKNVYLGHYKWWFYKACLGDKYDEYFSFAFKRNPFTRILSAYSYIKRGGNSNNDNEFLLNNKSSFISFDKFIKDLESNKTLRRWVHFQPQTDFIFDERDNLKIKHLATFESFEEEMSYITTKIPSINSNSHEKQSPKTSIEEHYTKDSTINIVRKIYARDFQLLGYKDTL